MQGELPAKCLPLAGTPQVEGGSRGRSPRKGNGHSLLHARSVLRAVPKTAGQPVGEGLGAGMPSSGILVINLSERGASSPQQASRRRLCLWGASTKSRGDTHFQVTWKVCEVFFCVCDVKFSPTVSEAVSGPSIANLPVYSKQPSRNTSKAISYKSIFPIRVP